MSAGRTHDVTTLLARWGTGTPQERERLFAALQPELRRIAAAYMREERPDHTLQPTALLNEAYLKLAGARRPRWEDRVHFFGIAARIMRQVLVDYARKHHAHKRKASACARVSAPMLADRSGRPDVNVVALHEALGDLAALDPRQAEIVELRYFGGLTEVEVARLQGLSPATIRREIATARKWLGRRLGSTR
jgi:RNA polymerase sigma factor (TIGR02999 family)